MYEVVAGSFDSMVQAVSAAGMAFCTVATILGYVRVSTTGQDLDAQLTPLAAAGVDAERLYTDKLSGPARMDLIRTSCCTTVGRACRGGVRPSEPGVSPRRCQPQKIPVGLGSRLISASRSSTLCDGVTTS